jgi:hypothetical protein
MQDTTRTTRETTTRIETDEPTTPTSTSSTTGEESTPAVATHREEWYVSAPGLPTRRRVALFWWTPRGLVLEHIRTVTVGQRVTSGCELDADATVDDLPMWLRKRLHGRLADDAATASAPVATDGGRPRGGRRG